MGLAIDIVAAAVDVVVVAVAVADIAALGYLGHKIAPAEAYPCVAAENQSWRVVEVGYFAVDGVVVCQPAAEIVSDFQFERHREFVYDA